MRTMNPVLKDDVFLRTRDFSSSETMSLQGSINKSIAAVGICFISAIISWHTLPQAGLIMPAILIGGIGGLIVALVTVFKKSFAPITTPIYAILEGGLLGGISWMFEGMYSGIVFQAVMLTFGVLFLMLTLYRTRIIKVTDKLRMGIVAAVGAIFLIYLVNFVMSFFGATIPYIHESGAIGIGFSLLVVGIAAFTLLLDFDNIERGSTAGLPKYMEWFCAFGLLVSLVWLYLEILQLLAKVQRR